MLEHIIIPAIPSFERLDVTPTIDNTNPAILTIKETMINAQAIIIPAPAIVIITSATIRAIDPVPNSDPINPQTLPRSIINAPLFSPLEISK